MFWPFWKFQCRLRKRLRASRETKEAAVIRLSRYILLVMLVLVALAALPASAQVINTDPNWNGTDTISSFGYPNTSTYGEAITMPAGMTNVQSVGFWLNEATGFEYQMFIAPWDNNNYLIPGGLAGAIYISPIQTTASGGTLTHYIINNINANVTPGVIYMFGLTIDNVYAYDAAYGAGAQGGDIFADGNSTYYFAWNNDSGNGMLLGANWNNEGCANNTGECGQAAWTIYYGCCGTPEPGSAILLGTGMVGLAGVVRRKLKF